MKPSKKANQIEILPKVVSDFEISELIELSKIALNKRSRICLHKDHSDIFQQMLICIRSNSYVVPHRQNGKLKSYIILKGSLNLYFFDNDGNVSRIITLDRKSKIVRYDASIWHTIMTYNCKLCLYIETIDGPYIRKDTEWANWAPTDEDAINAKIYKRKLSRSTMPE
ncbi:MAG: WbuC family cupin fold metalloprotein [Alphaproteobacteria bacterium]